MTHEIVTEIHYSGAWHDISADVLNRDPCTVERGRPDESSAVEPGSLTFTLNNGRSKVAGVVGRYTPRNPASDLYGLIGRNTPVRQSVDGNRRFTGEISEWPARWDLSGVDSYVSVKAYGILRRLGQGGGKALLPALKRRVLAVGADAYWPLDGGKADLKPGAEAFGRGALTPSASVLLDGLTDPEIDPVYRYGEDELAPWVGTGLSLHGKPIDDAALRSSWGGVVDMAPSPGAIRLACYMRWPSSEGNSTSESNFFVEITMRGTGSPRMDYLITIGVESIFTTVQVGGASVDLEGSHWPVAGGLYFVEITLSNHVVTANALSYSFKATAVDGGSTVTETVTLTGFATDDPLQSVGDIEIRNTLGASPGGPTSSEAPPALMGHLVIQSAATAAALPDLLEAGRGYYGEAAGRRIERLCAEEGIPLATAGDLDDTELLGHQQVAPILSLLDLARETDGGVLFEDRTEAGLEYITRRGLYNQPPALALDYRSGHVSNPFEPVDDDAFVRNDVTAKRVDGGERQAVKTSGPLSIAAPVDGGVGRYDRQLTLNTADDERLNLHAAAAVEIGTLDEARFPQVGFRVQKHPGLVPDYVDVDTGSVVTIDNPPPWLPPEQIRCLVQGYRETYSLVDWDCVWNTTPATPYIVGVLDVDRIDTDKATVATNFAAGTGTALSVAWAVGAARAAVGATSFYIQAAGVILHVTNIAGAGTPQTFTVDAAPTNGIVKTIAAGTPVRLAAPWRLAF